MNLETRRRHPLGVLAMVIALDALLMVLVWMKGEWFGNPAGTSMRVTEVVAWGLRGAILFTFLGLAWHDVVLLFVRPTKKMGTGWVRVWAVARATMFEAWAGRVWMLPVLWCVAGMLLILATRPFDESERIPLYIKALLSSQEVLLLVMMWVMACVSLPRERERKILVTNASKPLSRLEILLGKIVGFGVVSAGALAVMGVASLMILGVADLRVRSRAKEAYDLQVKDYNRSLVTPSEALKQLSEQGSLFAYNYISAPPGGMNVGVVALPRNADTDVWGRGLIGGTNERAIYQFSPRLEVHEVTFLRGPGRRPFFVFYFPLEFRGPKPDKVVIHVTAYGSGPWPRQEKDLTLNDDGAAYWEPDQPDQLFTSVDNRWKMVRDRGVVTVEVTCPTPGALLHILEGASPDPKTGEMPSGTETNVEFSNRQEELGMGLPQQTNFADPNPVVRGMERRSRQEIAGPTEKQPVRETAIYRFPGSSLRNVPVDKDGNFQLSLQLETFKGDNPEKPTVAGVMVRSLDRRGQAPFEKGDLEVREKRVMTIPVPAALLGNTDPSRRGDMVVMVYCATPGHSVSLVEDSVRIELPQTPFLVNWFKSETVILLEAVLLIALAAACSVPVGWPVAMLLSGVCVLFGHMQSMILELPQYGGLGALNYHPMGYNPALYNFFDKAATYLWGLMGFLAVLVPDFTQFQPEEYIGRLQNMPWSVLLNDLGSMVMFALPFLALAYLLFRKQELG